MKLNCDKSFMQVSFLKEQFVQRKIHKWEKVDIHFIDDCPQQDNGYVSLLEARMRNTISILIGITIHLI